MNTDDILVISIHEVFADLDGLRLTLADGGNEFQSTRSSQTSTALQNEFLSALIFQSTRSSQTSTKGTENPKGSYLYFNPRGLRRPRLGVRYRQVLPNMISIHEVFADLDETKILKHFYTQISIHEVFADLDRISAPGLYRLGISIHEVFADLDRFSQVRSTWTKRFQSTRSSQTSTVATTNFAPKSVFQSTRSSQTSTVIPFPVVLICVISIHEVFADLDSSVD